MAAVLPCGHASHDVFRLLLLEKVSTLQLLHCVEACVSWNEPGMQGKLHWKREGVETQLEEGKISVKYIHGIKKEKETNTHHDV